VQPRQMILVLLDHEFEDCLAGFPARRMFGASQSATLVPQVAESWLLLLPRALPMNESNVNGKTAIACGLR
jgi:hypothetical protein